MAIDPFFGSVLAGATNLVGGLIGGENQRKANENAKDAAEANNRRAWELAVHGTEIKAYDVMKAYEQTGIHPLALLGMSGPTYTPSTAAFIGGNPVGEGLGRMGQDISRGLHATADRELREKSMALQETALANSAERGALENELLRIRIASERARLTQVSAPAMPSPSDRWTLDGQIPDTTRLHQGMSVLPDASRESSSVPGVGYLKMPDGSYMPVKSKEATDRLEDDTLGNIKHFIQREFGPSFWEKDPGRPARPGYRWTVNFFGNWVEVPKYSAPSGYNPHYRGYNPKDAYK